MTIGCRQLPEAIADLVGDEGTVQLRRLVEQHAATCGRCAVAIEGLDAIVDRARTMAVPEPPSTYWVGFRVELRERIGRATAGPPRPQWVWLRSAAAVVAIIVVTLAVLDGSRPRDGLDLARAQDVIRALDPLSVASAITPPPGPDEPAPELAWFGRSGVAWFDRASGPFEFLDAAAELDAAAADALLRTLAEDLGT